MVLFALTVHDAGQGIDQAWIDEVTERFKQGSRADGGGSGLGLAIVKRIVERHDGEVKVRNHPDGGLEVMIELPLHDDGHQAFTPNHY